MRVALLTVSDSAAEGAASDLSGHLLHKLIAEGGGVVVRADVVPDDEQTISAWLCRAADEQRVDLVLTTGGTGLSPRDITPEATRAALDFEVPGIAEAIRALGMSKTPRAMLSRAVAGVRKGTLIINLSGSPKAVSEQWAVVEPVVEHAVATVQGRGEHPEADALRRAPTGGAAPSTRPPPKERAAAPPFTSTSSTLVGTPLSEVLGESQEALLREKGLPIKKSGDA